VIHYYSDEDLEALIGEIPKTKAEKTGFMLICIMQKSYLDPGFRRLPSPWRWKIRQLVMMKPF
jgi:hypothetical protein